MRASRTREENSERETTLKERRSSGSNWKSLNLLDLDESPAFWGFFTDLAMRMKRGSSLSCTLTDLMSAYEALLMVQMVPGVMSMEMCLEGWAGVVFAVHVPCVVVVGVLVVGGLSVAMFFLWVFYLKWFLLGVGLALLFLGCVVENENEERRPVAFYLFFHHVFQVNKNEL